MDYDKCEGHDIHASDGETPPYGDEPSIADIVRTSSVVIVHVVGSIMVQKECKMRRQMAWNVDDVEKFDVENESCPFCRSCADRRWCSRKAVMAGRNTAPAS